MYSLILSLALFGYATSSPIDTSSNFTYRVNPLSKYARADLYQGDIMWEDDGTVAKIGANGVIDKKYYWTDSVLVYELDKKFKKNELKIIDDGFKLISSKTCIKFRPKKKEKAFVLIKRGGRDSGCWSSVGMLGKKQELNLEIPGCDDASTVAHELMHALGVHHEQCRKDRDDYIEVRWDNIEKDQWHNFDIERGTSSFDTPYDYESIMQYDRKAFSKNGKETMVPKGDKWTKELGNNERLTDSDAIGLNAMYC